MRKGFIHIVEIVLISVVLFVLIFQIATVPASRSDWKKTRLVGQGWDLLFSVDRAGVNWMNPTQVRGWLSGLLPSNILYDVKVRPAINVGPTGVVSVGCICSDSEMAEINGILAPFTLNGESVDFFVEKLNTTDITLPLKYDVIVMRNYNLTGLDAQVRRYLSAGKGLVEIRDLGQGDIDSVQTDIFGVNWTSGFNPSANSIQWAIGKSGTFGYIYKYFYGIGRTSPPTVFANVLSDTENITAVNGVGNTILSQTGTGVSALVARSDVFGTGRVAWLSDGQFTGRESMIKALVSWAAGDTYNVVPGSVANPITLSLYTAANNEMYQPLEVILSLGYVY